MKTKIVFAALLLIALASSSFAFPNNSNLSAKEITTSLNIKKLVVDKYINVVLVNDDSKTSITVTGDKNFIDEITITSDNGEMTISSKKNIANKKITVFVPVKALYYLELKSGAHVSSEGILKCPNLSVLVNSGSKLELKNLGHVDVKSTDDCEFVYEKNEVSKVEYVK